MVNLHSVEVFAVHDGGGDGLHSLLCPCRVVGESCVEAHVSVSVMCCDGDAVSLLTTKISTSFPLILISDEVYFLPLG